MRILLFGTAGFALPSLECLVAHGHQILACVTQPDRPQGRGLALKPSPVKSAALRHGLAVEEPQDLKAALSRFQALQPDVGVVVSYGRLIPPALLPLPRDGLLGVHPSLLPKYRGASPIAWAILNGEESTGVTVFRLNERLDAGDVMLQRAVAIEPRETAERLSERLARLGGELLIEAIGRLARGEAVFTPQDERQATDAPKLMKAQGQIDWCQSAASIDRRVRAMIPWPGAYTDWRSQSMRLWTTRYDSQNHTTHRQPGEIMAVSPEGLVVATGEGKLVIQELQVAGRRRMTAREFLAGHDMRPGEIFGGGKWNVESGKK